ncbi:tRNA (adenosine(37)-N6)-dimethylallyltransferase MiaA [Pacificimonas flava]|uniref:tRNA dimethylallyltransferase n=2 Tax=Pacificimonas TaxID=1960290 RepID=A0A219B803_9SPHN|nr:MULTISPECIES: tRNA (adenosine(37)-N6)-dimethylallyltransferase MiaA [Pacificimonas]MBZ6378381.1 tRNA (adenosine(37)-N6)-dimethylallyltransferase MiaA [Pacificimonas aurantium]OWV34314.1 tRNA (adenosine(37)-N6)-dimethylallyltransferase MiaA [Pacificimonas flava]
MNKSDPPEKRLVVIAGPTASGKSAAALDVAQAEQGTVINADASQVYRDLKILSARPDEDEMAGIPHRLYGCVDGAEACSAADWAAMAKREIAAVRAEGRLPILCGGTGLYLNTLILGLAPVPEIDPEIRSDVRDMETGELAAALEREDPRMSAELRPSDTQRLARALEVVRSTGRSLAQWRTERTGGIASDTEIDFRVVDLPRDQLYARCDTRFDLMIEAGALEEVGTLMDRKLAPDLPVMKAIGVPPLAAHLRGELSLEDAVEQAKRDTRRYAKRQQAWFRTQRPVASPVAGPETR